MSTIGTDGNPFLLHDRIGVSNIAEREELSRVGFKTSKMRVGGLKVVEDDNEGIVVVILSLLCMLESVFVSLSQL